MVRQSISRRRFLLATGVAGVGGLAGCSDDGETSGGDDGTDADETDADGTATGTPAEGTEGEQTGEPVSEGDSVTVSGRLIGPEGDPVTVGEAISLGDPEGLLAVAPDENGAFSLELTSGSRYVLQYTQGADRYPTDGLADLYTIGQRTPTSDVDLGDVSLPTAYEVDVTIETADGEDVTDDASVSVSHTNDGTTSGFGLTNNPIELVGEITLRVRYDGTVTEESVTVTGAQSVTVTVN